MVRDEELDTDSTPSWTRIPEQADLNLQRTYLATQSVTLAAQRIPVSEERCVFFGAQGN